LKSSRREHQTQSRSSDALELDALNKYSPPKPTLPFAPFGISVPVAPSIKLVGNSILGRKWGATGRIRLWAKQWRWADRAAAWDADLEAVRRTRFVQASEAVAERQAVAARLFLQQVEDKLVALTPEDIGQLSPKDLIRWFVTGVNIERQARGLPAVCWPV
jgi:hypothetical protein